MRIGRIIKDWRWANRVNIRDMAKELGVSHSTLSRLESGENMDGETLGRILQWMLEPDPKPAQKKKQNEMK